MPETTQSGTPTVTTSGTAIHPDVRAPPFSAEKPALWFAQLEAQFRNRGIVTEQDKYNRTIPLIDTRSAAEAEDIIINPPADIPYQTLKRTLITRFSKSREANLLQLLDRESIGDRSPSHYLRYLRSLVPDIDDEVLKARWLSHLPEQTRACLVIQKDATITQLGELADKLHEVYHPTVAAVSTSTVSMDVAQLTKQVAALTASVAALHKRDSRPRSSTRSGDSRGQRSKSRRRSSSRKVPNKFNTCWYHFKFGRDARTCQPGCKFQENAGERRSLQMPPLIHNRQDDRDPTFGRHGI
ncbi:uncharacterized protein LOC135169590 [Diachasmimorpha longicaudata]|uniref:uncharacterized protein LOC135169590 n=1 Tax=Diachasmimorpha longicaudata TaxID=58733 RepID=UPI0030B8F8ED